MRLEDTEKIRGDSRFLVAGDLVLDTHDERAWLTTGRLELGSKAMALLGEFMRHPQILLTKDRLFECAWPDQAVSDAVLTTSIRELRRALGDPARNSEWIETQHGKGYRFLRTVEARAVHPGRRKEAPAGSREPIKPRRATWILAALAAVGALILSWVMLGGDAPAEDREARLSAGGTVAVLSFTVEGGEDWIGSAMASRLTEVLKNAPDLVVADQRLVAALAELDRPWEGAAADDIDAVVLGAVSVRNGTIVADVTIRDAEGAELWSRRMSDTQDEVIGLTERIAFETARALKIAGDPRMTAEMAKVGTNSVAAFSAYSRAMQTLDSIDGYRRPGALEEGIENLRKAVAIDPTFGKATSSLAWFEYPGPYQENAAEAEAKAIALAELGIEHARDPLERDIRQATMDLRNLQFEKARQSFERLYEKTRKTSSDQNNSILIQLAQIAAATRNQALADTVWREMTDYNLARGRIQFKDPLFIAYSKSLLLRYAKHMSQQDKTAIGTSFRHSALLLAGELNEAAHVLENADLSSFSPYLVIMQVGQACAEGRASEARRIGREAINKTPAPSWTNWRIAQTAGLRKEIARFTPPARDPASQRALLRMMYEPGFDPGPYPLLVAALQAAGVRAEPVPRPDFYCNLA